MHIDSTEHDQNQDAGVYVSVYWLDLPSDELRAQALIGKTLKLNVSLDHCVTPAGCNVLPYINRKFGFSAHALQGKQNGKT